MSLIVADYIHFVKRDCSLAIVVMTLWLVTEGEDLRRGEETPEAFPLPQPSSAKRDYLGHLRFSFSLTPKNHWDNSTP